MNPLSIAVSMSLAFALPSIPGLASEVKKITETVECIKDPKLKLSKKTKCIEGPKPAAAPTKAATPSAADFDPSLIPGAPQLKSKFFKK